MRNQRRAAAAFLAPAVLLLMLFVVWPIARAIYFGFTSADVLAPQEARWRGLANYGELISDPRFRQAFYNTALFSLMVVPLQTTLAFFAALLVNRREPYWRSLRAVFFTSQLVSLPVLAISWSMLYDAIGLAPKDWLLSPDRALVALAIMSVWQGVGFQMLVFLAGLQNVSPELLDAAKVDGAGPLRRLAFVIVPQMKRSIAVNVVVTTILSFRLFVQPYLLTRGGPDDRTLSVIEWIYQTTFFAHELGRACAGVVVFLLIVAVLVWAQRFFLEGARTMRRLFGWTVSIVTATAFLAPILWMVCASLLPDEQVFARGFFGVVSAKHWTFENYGDAWRRGALGLGFLNSFLQLVLITVLGLFVNSTAAYAFARLRFRGREVLFGGVVALIILPLEVLALPLLLTVSELGLTGGRSATLAALTLPFAAKAFNIYFLRQHFLAIPRELEEAAAIDGASTWRFYWSIAMPAIRPALVTVVLLDVLTHWSDFIWPLMVTTRADTHTVQLSLASLFTQPPIAWGDVLACAVMVTLPVIVLFQIAQRRLVITDLGAGIR